MYANRYQVAALAVALLVPLVLTTGGASAAASPTEPCKGVDETTLVGFFDTDERVSGVATVYPQTTLTLYVCTRDDPEAYGTAWGFDGERVAGLQVTDERDTSVVVQVTPASGEVRPATAVTRKPDIGGPTLRVQQGHVASDRIGDTQVTLHFVAAGDRRQFVQAAEAFRAKTDAVENASTSLARFADSEGAGVLAPQSSMHLRTIATTNVSSAETNLEHEAFAATSSGDIDGARTAIGLADQRGEAVTTDARDSLRAYETALADRRAAAATTVRMVLGGGLIGGLIGGTVLGYGLSRRTLRKVEQDRTISTATQYSLKHIAVPLVLGVLALLVGVAGLVYGGGSFIGVLL